MGDSTSLVDWHRQFMQQPMLKSSPTVELTLYGNPIVLESYREITGEEVYRVTAWMEGEQGRTKPLVEERYTYRDFHHMVNETARTASHQHLYAPGTHGGPIETFLVEWAKKNWRSIEQAEYRRRSNSSAFTDLGTRNASDLTAPIPTRTYTGEDGKTYTELDLRGEDTDPVLLEATMNRDRILAAALEAEKREKEEAKRILQENLARKKREQAEFEAIPGFGSF